MKKKQSINYKEAVDKIEKIIAEIEKGDPGVDELTSMVDEAFTLIKLCKNKLKSTEEKLQVNFEEDEMEN